VAKHRMTKRRRTHRAVTTAAAAAGLSGVLVLGHSLDYTAQLDPALAAAVFGVGGRGDPTSANVKNKLGGEIGPSGSYTYTPIAYPADFNFQTSTNQGVKVLKPLVISTSGDVQVTAYSEGTLVAEQVKRDLAAGNYPEGDPGGAGQVTFLLIASPYVPNGGLFARFPGFTIPGVVPVFSAAEPTEYDSTYVTNEYDPYADFPAYFNPLSLANSLLAVQYAHPDQYYDNIDPNANTAGNYTTTVTNSAGGTDTYVLVYNPQLPLFGPIRQIEAAVPELKPLIEPLVSAVEPLTRVFVDMGYTDRTNENPQTPTTFSLVTPPANVIGAAEKVPGAIGQGIQNLLAGHDVTPVPPAKTTTVPAPQDQTLKAVVPQTGQDQPALAPEPPTPPTDQTPKTKTKDTPLDKLVDRITHPNVKDGDKVTPTTKAPATGFGHGPAANLLKSVLGGGKSEPSAADDSQKPADKKPSGEESGAAA
jgi:diacyltrehalose acyltransferase